jgi:CBS domain containing-hemolysin-like protein
MTGFVHKMTDTSPQPAPESPHKPAAPRLFDWLRKVFSGKGGEASLRESLEEVIEEHENDQTEFSEEERSMLLNTLRFAELRIDDVMVPRADIVAVEAETPLDDVVKAFVDASVSRMPVYRGSLDEVVAMVHLKDIFKLLVNLPEQDRRAQSGKAFLAEIQRPILFVPPSMRLPDVLVKMRSKRIHMALVVDEYGGTDGLVTIEDLVEQIVGEIEDEHDFPEQEMLITLPDGSFEVDARFSLKEFEDKLGRSLASEDLEEEVDSVGGLMTAIAGRVPQKGESIEIKSGYVFEVLDADPRRLKRMRIRPASPAAHE